MSAMMEQFQAMMSKPKPIVRKLIAEFLGTYMLMFTVGCNVTAAGREGSHGLFAAISIASVLMVTIYAMGPVSGANFNPSVTMAVVCSGKLDWKSGGMYMLVQCLAGFFGCISFYGLYGQGIPFGPHEGSLFSWYQVLTAEFFYTFMLSFVVVNTACVKEGNQYFGLAIGFVIAAAGNAAGWISGGAFNPAIGLGLDLSSYSMGFGWCLPYIITQLIAGAAAAFVFRFIRPYEFVEPGAEVSYPRLLASRLVAEFIGAFFIVMTVGLNVVKGTAYVESNPINETAVFSISSCVMVMVYCVGTVSGGHLNPAVTMAVWASGRGKITRKEALAYMGAQVFGGIIGACIFVFVSGGFSFPLGPYAEFSWAGVVAAEFVFTWLLCFVVLCTATLRQENSNHSKDIFGLAIGFSVVAGGYAISAVSGAALNPAVAIGVDTLHGIIEGGWYRCVFYTIIELCAGAFAAFTFRLVYPDEFDDTTQGETSYKMDQLNDDM